MEGKLLSVVLLVLPLLTFGCLVAGIVLRGRLPLWLVVGGALAPIVVVVYVVISTPPVHGRDLDYLAIAASLWALIVAGLLTTGYLANRQARRSGAALTLTGLAMSVVPFVPIALFVLWIAFTGGME